MTERRNEKGFTVLELAIVLADYFSDGSTVFVALNFYSQEQRRIRARLTRWIPFRPRWRFMRYSVACPVRRV
ncbi:MAG: hypothetical protein R3D66_02000 [Alphaproteobacteria bacterium]